MKLQRASVKKKNFLLNRRNTKPRVNIKKDVFDLLTLDAHKHAFREASLLFMIQLDAVTEQHFFPMGIDKDRDHRVVKER